MEEESESPPKDGEGMVERMAEVRQGDRPRRLAHFPCHPYLALFIFGALDARRGLIHASRRTHTLLMAKRRTVIDSDDEQDGKQASPSSSKRSRLDTAEHRSSKSKGKGKTRDDNDLLNDLRVDEDDDITAIRDAHAEGDDGSQERFEEEHEESIRESIRQRNRQQGVGSS